MSDSNTNEVDESLNQQQDRITDHKFILGQWLVEPDLNQLSNGEQTISIVPKLMETLCYFAEHQGQVISGQTLTKAIWQNSVVGENSLYNNIAQLRKYLGDTGRKKTYIETIPRKGYRLVASVSSPQQQEQEQQQQSQQVIEATPKPTFKWQTVALSAAVVVLLSISALLMLNNPISTPTTIAQQASVSTIAVYPFDDLAPTNNDDDEQNNYFAHGLSENLIFRLNHIPGLRVISPTTANTIKQKQLPINQLKSDYGIGSILKGSIQKSENHIRVIVQLTDTTDGGVLWSTKFDKPLKDLFTIQDNMAQAIADTLRVKLTAANRPAGITVAAFDHYLIGRFYWNKRHQQDTERAITHFNKAIEISPNYAQAWAGLGDSYIFLNAYGDMQMEQAYEKAEKHLAKALELNPNLGEALASLGQIRMNQENYDDAENYLQQAIQANPNYVTARQWYGILLNNLGRHDEALKQHNMALSLDPLSAIVNRNMAFTQLMNGNKTAARANFDRSLTLAPIFFGSEFLSLNFHPLTRQMAEKAILFIKQNYPAIPNTVPHKVTLSLLSTSVGALEKSQQYISEAQQLQPGHPRIFDAKIALQAAMEQWHEVIYLLEQRRRTQPNNHQLQLQLAYAHYLNNDIEAVKSIIKSAHTSLATNTRFVLLKLLLASDDQKAQLLASLKPNNDVSIVNAAVMSFKGDNQQALGILEKLLDLGWTEDASQQWWSFESDPALAGLKQHPQFAALVNRLAKDKQGLKGLFRGS